MSQAGQGQPATVEKEKSDKRCLTRQSSGRLSAAADFVVRLEKGKLYKALLLSIDVLLENLKVPVSWNVHVLQRVPFEGLGSIESWLAARRATVRHTRFFESSDLPDVADLDLVIALGGPMSVNDEATLLWIANEKRFISAAIHAGKAVLGICLGAQLIAKALGSRVYPGQHKEIGWFDIESTSESPDLFQFPKTATVFHWHGETFELPPRASRLARSAGCENQAFQIGSKVMGLQFHLETTPESVESIIGHCRDELIDRLFIQSEEELRRVPAASCAAVNALMVKVLSYITCPKEVG
jgi:GMP synthase-like glutamine amidotransferase